MSERVWFCVSLSTIRVGHFGLLETIVSGVIQCWYWRPHSQQPGKNTHKNYKWQNQPKCRLIIDVHCVYKYINKLWHTTTPQPFYGPFSRITRVSRCQKRTSGLMMQGKINRGRHTDHPDGRHSIRTKQCPPWIVMETEYCCSLCWCYVCYL